MAKKADANVMKSYSSIGNGITTPINNYNNKYKDNFSILISNVKVTKKKKKKWCETWIDIFIF